jgi:hypothetical protein
MIHLERYFQNNQISDITYIGIGSACIRDSNPENMQQFPPWLESEYRNSKKTFCLINIDPKFESPYLLTQILPIEEDEISSTQDGLMIVFKTDRLKCIYINEELNYCNVVNGKYIVNDLMVKPLDTINQQVIKQSKLLISGIYTGFSNDILEQYFSNKYSQIYKYAYNTFITYNFMNDKHGFCMVNLMTNFPLVDYSTNQIIKIDEIIENLDFETIKNIYGPNIYGLEKKIINWSINKLKQLLNIEIYLYRNYLNCNFQPSMDLTIQKSIFKNINFRDFTNHNTNIAHMIKLINSTYLPYVNILKSSLVDTSEIDNCFHSIPSTPSNIYTWNFEYTKAINRICQTYLK